eukprot:Sspe_Gene.91287::Locus_62741_Transcript_1_1_Confidence_1.000_Length_2904::g.91287::m.91287
MQSDSPRRNVPGAPAPIGSPARTVIAAAASASSSRSSRLSDPSAFCATRVPNVSSMNQKVHCSTCRRSATARAICGCFALSSLTGIEDSLTISSSMREKMPLLRSASPSSSDLILVKLRLEGELHPRGLRGLSWWWGSLLRNGGVRGEASAGDGGVGGVAPPSCAPDAVAGVSLRCCRASMPRRLARLPIAGDVVESIDKPDGRRLSETYVRPSPKLLRLPTGIPASLRFGDPGEAGTEIGEQTSTVFRGDGGVVLRRADPLGVGVRRAVGFRVGSGRVTTGDEVGSTDPLMRWIISISPSLKPFPSAMRCVTMSHVRRSTSIRESAPPNSSSFCVGEGRPGGPPRGEPVRMSATEPRGDPAREPAFPRG